MNPRRRIYHWISSLRLAGLGSFAEQGAIGKLLRALLIRVLLYGAVFLAIVGYLVGFQFLLPQRFFQDSPNSESTASKHLDHGFFADAQESETGWPHLRGPHYTAISDETDLADSWPAEGPPVLWTRKIGQGYSGAIVVSNRLFTQTQTLTEQKVVALNADTGQTIWEHTYDWPYEAGGMYPGPRSTPTWYKGKIYCVSPDGLVMCLRADDGEEVWSINVLEKFSDRGVGFGYSCSPLVEEGKVIFPVGGPHASVVALDADDGSTLWASGDAPASYCSAIPITFQGNRQVVAFMQNELSGYDINTGRVLWRHSYSKGYDEHAAYPLYREPYLRTTMPFRKGSELFLLQNTPSPEPAEEESCTLKLVRLDRPMSNDVASSVLYGDYVYGFDLCEIQTRRQRASRGEFRCIDFMSGEIRWSNKSFGQATVVVADEKLFLFNDRGEVILARADPTRCEELARAEVFRDEICWTAPCLNRGRLFVRSPTHLTCLYVGKPEKLDETLRNRAVPTSALPKKSRWDWSWLIGSERDAAFDLPDIHELKHWYWYCLATFVTVALLTAGVYGSLKYCDIASARFYSLCIFYFLAMICGVAATPLANSVSTDFVFTWPIALFAGHQVALTAVYAAKLPGDRKRAWLGAAGTVFLICICVVYYDFTRRLSFGAGWYFLPTFLAAWPLAIPAARKIFCPGSMAGDMLRFILAFTLYYWISAGFMLWRASLLQ